MSKSPQRRPKMNYSTLEATSATPQSIVGAPQATRSAAALSVYESEHSGVSARGLKNCAWWDCSRCLAGYPLPGARRENHLHAFAGKAVEIRRLPSNNPARLIDAMGVLITRRVHLRAPATTLPR